MGLYFRKSKSVGPFRINFSKSGIGLSAGVKGARISMGPKGTYVNAGRGGIYYRKKIGGKAKKKTADNNIYARANRAANKTSRTSQSYSENTLYSIQSTQNYNMSMNPNGIGIAVVETIKKAKMFNSLWWISMIIFMLLSINTKALWFFVLVDIVLRVVFREWFTVHIDFELDSQEKKQWREFTDALEIFGGCSKKWLTSQNSYYFNSSALRNPVSFKKSSGSLFSGRVHTKNEYIGLISSSMKVFFLPQIILLQNGSKIAAYSYDELNMKCDTARINLGVSSVPSDAEVVNYVFEHTTKDGSPDLRFKVNRRFPVCQFVVASFSGTFGGTFTLIGSNRRIQPILNDALNMYHPKISSNILLNDSTREETKKATIANQLEEDINKAQSNVDEIEKIEKPETIIMHREDVAKDNGSGSNRLLSEILNNTEDRKE